MGTPRGKESRADRHGRALQSMAPGTVNGRITGAAPVPRRGDDEKVDEAVVANVLLIRTGATVPPDTPYGTIIVEDATGTYTG